MLFWISVLILVIGIAMMAIDRRADIIWFLGLMIDTVGFVGFIVSIVFLFEGHVNIKGCTRRLNSQYESLIYQYENDIYDNDNDLGKRELMEDIQKWNEDLAWYQEAQNDFWIGIFIPDIYDQFDYIALE